MKLLEAIDFSRFTFLDWLVSPETDCLTYLLMYAKRVAAAADTAAAEVHWRLPNDYVHRRVAGLFEGLVGSLRRLDMTGSLPFRSNVLCDRLQSATDVLHSMEKNSWNSNKTNNDKDVTD